MHMATSMQLALPGLRTYLFPIAVEVDLMPKVQCSFPYTSHCPQVEQL